mgnify:FL=1
MANFGNKNETFAYLVGKDIAEIKAKIEGIGTTSGGLDVLKVIVPAATEEQVNNNAICVVPLPEEFQGALLMYEQYGGQVYATSETELGIPLENAEKEVFIIKITDFKNPKETTHAVIRYPRRGGGAASDA